MCDRSHGDVVGAPGSRWAAGLAAVGIGLDRSALTVVPTSEGWVRAGQQLATSVGALLGPSVVAVVPIGSTSVVGMRAKPIIDLAVGVEESGSVDEVQRRLVGAGWRYRGDAGERGGLVFVLEVRPGIRVAHLHVVDHGGRQWTEYLRLRDVLRSSPEARRRYGLIKADLVERYAGPGRTVDRESYTDGKTEVVSELLTWTAADDR